MHYDFRIELDGVMLSWAVPKGPSYGPKDKRQAAHVEDPPISYSSFEGTIPAGQYGPGKVIVWDEGTWQPIGDAHASLKAGHLKFELRGHKLKGKWALIRMKGRGEKQEPWLLIKERDEYTRPSTEFSVVDELPDSAKSAVKAPNPKAARSPPARRRRQPRGADAVDQIVKPPVVPRAGRRSAKADAAPHPNARAGSLPATFSPQLATLVDSPPGDHADWSFEIKFDGYRLLARIDAGKIQLFTRNGNDSTAKLNPFHAELTRMKLPDGWYDGEIVVLNDKGVPDFGALQNAFDAPRAKSIGYFVFDAPWLAASTCATSPSTRAAAQSRRRSPSRAPRSFVSARPSKRPRRASSPRPATSDWKASSPSAATPPTAPPARPTGPS